MLLNTPSSTCSQNPHYAPSEIPQFHCTLVQCPFPAPLLFTLSQHTYQRSDVKKPPKNPIHVSPPPIPTPFYHPSPSFALVIILHRRHHYRLRYDSAESTAQPSRSSHFCHFHSTNVESTDGRRRAQQRRKNHFLRVILEQVGRAAIMMEIFTFSGEWSGSLCVCLCVSVSVCVCLCLLVSVSQSVNGRLCASTYFDANPQIFIIFHPPLPTPAPTPGVNSTLRFRRRSRFYWNPWSRIPSIKSESRPDQSAEKDRPPPPSSSEPNNTVSLFDLTLSFYHHHGLPAPTMDDTEFWKGQHHIILSFSSSNF